jgi:hypothetical protein
MHKVIKYEEKSSKRARLTEEGVHISSMSLSFSPAISRRRPSDSPGKSCNAFVDFSLPTVRNWLPFLGVSTRTTYSARKWA